MMPRKGFLTRAHQLAALTEVIHDRKIDPRIPDWLDDILSKKRLSRLEDANLKEISRIFSQTSKVPKKLSTELSKKIALSQEVWADARSAGKTIEFVKALKEIIRLKRSEADCIREASQDRYEALLQQFEPNQNNESLRKTLKALKRPLQELRDRILGSSKNIKDIRGKFDGASQIKISKKILQNIGYDFSSGRLDESLHPFSSGHRSDARITTRIDEATPLSCISSVLHEAGHAIYEQGIPEYLSSQPSGSWCSMGFHESQSRFFENQIGRSLPFCEYLFPLLIKYFPSIGINTPEELHLAINKVSQNFIRVDSDEVSYNLHIVLRYEIEEMLILGSLEAEDIEDEWNRRFYKTFNLEIMSPIDGFLQDIHWSAGLFGYFPTYSLGNLYAAALLRRMELDLKDLTNDVRSGDFAKILQWLRENIHSKGRLFKPDQLLKNTTGYDVSIDPLMSYLSEKFESLYDI